MCKGEILILSIKEWLEGSFDKTRYNINCVCPCACACVCPPPLISEFCNITTQKTAKAETLKIYGIQTSYFSTATSHFNCLPVLPPSSLRSRSPPPPLPSLPRPPPWASATRPPHVLPLVVGDGVDESHGAARVPDALLHEVQVFGDLLAVGVDLLLLLGLKLLLLEA